MQIEITKEEGEILIKALAAWEADATQTALLNTMMVAMLTPPNEVNRIKAETKRDLDDAGIESQVRKQQSVILQARIYEAIRKDSPSMFGIKV